MVWCFEPDFVGIQLFLVQNWSYLKHPSPSLLFLDLFDGPQIGQAAKKRKPWKARVPGKVREGSECQMSQSMTQSGEYDDATFVADLRHWKLWCALRMNVWCICIHWPPRLPKSIDMLCSQHWILGWWWYCLITFTHQQWGKTPGQWTQTVGTQEFCQVLCLISLFPMDSWLSQILKHQTSKFVKTCKRMWKIIYPIGTFTESLIQSYVVIYTRRQRIVFHKMLGGLLSKASPEFPSESVSVNHFSKTLHAHTVFRCF